MQSARPWAGRLRTVAVPRHSVVSSANRLPLLQAIVRQARDKALPELYRDLVEPWFAQPKLPSTRPRRELAAPKSKFATVLGVELHYMEVGSPSDKPSLVLWHGFNGSVFNWRYMLDEWAEMEGPRHIIAFDRPPFGLSERPPAASTSTAHNPYSSQGAVELARGLLKHLGVSSAVHVGHSAGASLALRMALEHPEEVDSLIFVSPAVRTTQAKAENAGSLLRTLYMRFLLGNDTAGLRYVQKRILESSKRVRDRQGVGRHDNERVTEEDIYYYLLPALADDWDVGALANFRSFEIAPPPDIDSLTKPVLVIEGLQDKTTPPTFVMQLVDKLRKRPAGSTEYIELEDCGHLPMEEYPSAMRTSIDAFVSKSD